MPLTITTVTLNPSLDEWVYLPRVALGRLNRATRFVRYPGGKGINVSRVVRELRVKTLALALAGGDDGRLLSHLLTQGRIPHEFVIVPGSTRNNYAIQTEHPRALTQINCPGPRVSAGLLRRLTQRLCRRLGDCVVFSGSLPPGAPSTTYSRLIHAVKREGMLTVLDTSGPALRQGLAAAPWLIKPNREEAESLLGKRLRRRAHIAKAAKHLTTRGPHHVLISLGAAGAVLASQAYPEVLWAEAPAVRVDSAVGAGDSLVAGFVVGWLRPHVGPSGWSIRRAGEALRLGVACGTACAMTPGTELCHRRDVLRLLPRIRIRTIG